MAKHRTYSVAFKRQVVQEFLAGETLHSLGRRHDISRNLIRIWVGKYEAGAFDDDAQAADLIQEYEAARSVALERLWATQQCRWKAAAGTVRANSTGFPDRRMRLWRWPRSAMDKPRT